MIRLCIFAVGKLRKGPELSLVDDYLTRASKTGRQLGIGDLRVVEVEDKKRSGKAAEAMLLQNALPDKATLWALDERGKTLSSPDFAAQIAKERDDGVRDLAIIIGGADGIDPALRARCDLAISFGKMVWPHMLARVMLAEQIYRATTILTGGPYHRT